MMINLFSMGVNHRTAPIDVRESIWFSVDETKEALRHLKERHFSECMLISTCNRTELYGIPLSEQINETELTRTVIDLKKADAKVQPEHFVCSFAGKAVQHLFKVSGGIDSMVVGDIQILSQVKEAFNISKEMNTLGLVMSRLMQSALRVGKRARKETSISDGAVSVSYAAVELANKIFEDLSKKSVLLIGAGKTGELTVKHLKAKGVSHLIVANRTREKSEALVGNLGGSVVDYDNFFDALRTVDIVITSVSSPSYILQTEDIQKIMKQRSNNSLFIIDIGVPRNVHPASKKIENVFLYDIDSLAAIVDKNLQKRKAEIPKVTNIIREEMVDFFRWYNSMQVGPAIRDLQAALESIRQQEVEKNINRFKPEDRELVDLVTKRILNKILHQPMTVLKHGAEDGKKNDETFLHVQALRKLFGIKSDGEKADEE